ncbi:adenosylcobinamide-GDP ribazoletransferase [Nocardioides limicola]|uniref:adenosylcobinamide-GDP ribazoletransferase n=1 Tax=Nocardioides limicola TaxID=2803368 RepID=UPI00193B2204|nr:adenosylcobinamide-GDP ribazoletransferase [Nocardioides sp. DJM-14]
MSVLDPVRLAFGTLSVWPVRAPRSVDRRTAGAAMVLAPVVGAVLAVLVAVPVWVLEQRDAPALLVAVAAVAAMAVLTRAIHLDGLADTADGFGSGRRGEAALAVMRQSDVGPFGVVTLVLVLLGQVALLAHAVAAGQGAIAVALALIAGRAVLPLLCSPLFDAARSDGLGRLVAGSVPPIAVPLSWAVAVTLGVTAMVLSGATGEIGGSASGVIGGSTTGVIGGSTTGVIGGSATGVIGSNPTLLAALALSVPVLLAMAAALTAAWLLTWRAVTRFGGVTGDVLGAAVEAATTAALLAVTLLLT